MVGHWDRRHASNPRPGPRSEARRDRDRLLYSDAFRRLDGITQVVAPVEGHIYHNRLTHTLKVAQVGSSIAQRLLRDGATADEIDVDVVETAGLIHDLGHPPFGHVAEKELDVLVKPVLHEGYEGNAQSFRLVTKIERCLEEHNGLNLTRRVLAASIKYPWLRGSAGGDESKKWGFYQSEKADFDFCRPDGGTDKALEAEVMDLADDITYSVHDAEDFYRAGLIPLDKLTSDEAERNRLVESAATRKSAIERDPDSYRSALERVLVKIPSVIDSPYYGSQKQRARLRTWVSVLIDRYVKEVTFERENSNGKKIVVPEELLEEIEILKQATWHYVILHPGLATQQLGYRTVIRTLFDVYAEAARSGDSYVLPPRYRDALQNGDEWFGPLDDAQRAVRLAADVISGFTDQEALHVYRRVCGFNPGAITDVLLL